MFVIPDKTPYSSKKEPKNGTEANCSEIQIGFGATAGKDLPAEQSDQGAANEQENGVRIEVILAEIKRMHNGDKRTPLLRRNQGN